MTDRARELVERLREADANSVQRCLGSRIFAEAADFIEQSLTPPEGDTVSEGVVERVAKTIHDAMVYAVCEFKGEPRAWQNGNSTAESYARREARDIIAALQSRVSPGLREALEKCESDNAKLLGWLYEACDGFPVSQEAMDAVSRDVETLEAIRDCSDGDGISLGEFRQKVLAKIDAALSTDPTPMSEDAK